MSGLKDHFLGDDLFSYPHHPGFRGPSTSREAAIKMKSRSGTLREKVLELLRDNPSGLTVHEAAAMAEVTVPAIQPRFSELVDMGKIKPSGERRRNASRMSAAVWIICE